MSYILDTHTAIWVLEEKSKLSDKAKMIIDDTCIPLFVSIISAWEIAIKVNMGKLEFVGGCKKFLEEMRVNGVEIVGIKDEYLELLENLTFNHKDPFDRLLIATALAEELTIITIDENIQNYDVPWVW